jgi:hypothetical protein
VETEPAWLQWVEAIDDFLPSESAKPVEDAASPLLEDLTAREHEVLERVTRASTMPALRVNLVSVRRRSVIKCRSYSPSSGSTVERKQS